MASPKFETIKQMLEFYYGPNTVNKDAPVLSSTTGVFNAVYGAYAFYQLNGEANAFGVLPKYPWPHSGFRAITADAGSSADGGVAENAAIPATVKPTFVEVDVTPKQVAHAFDVSFIQSGLVKKTADDAIGDMDFLRGYFAVKHAKAINQQLLVDADTLAGDNFESIDRITISSAASVALGYTAGDEDIYDIDRSGASWADATVSHNSGTDRTFSDALLTSLLSSLETAGARTNLLLTGNDTKWRIFSVYGDQVRYAGVVEKNQMVQIGINGVETEEGLGVGMRVATVYGIPLFSSQSVPQDTISRIYALDTTMNEETGIPRLGIALLYPTMYFESGLDTAFPDPFAVNRFGTEGVYYTAGELVCTFFKAQGSLRDLK